jgi:tetratricopeptide (TPR) repeat protein
MTGSADDKRDFFVSFNQADRAWATWIAWTLEDAGYKVLFQDWDFAGNFVLKMHEAIQRSHRMIAVLSPDYLTSAFTAPEWAAVFAQNPTSARDLLVPVRVRACEPEGLLAPIVYLDLIGSTRDQARELLLKRVSGKRPKPGEEPTFPPPSAPLPAAVRTIKQEPRFPVARHNLPPANRLFIGRRQELERLRTALEQGGTAAITPTQAIVGLGGIGKSSLALAYAYAHLADYALIRWLRAEESATVAADFAAMAGPLGLPTDMPDQAALIQAVRERLEARSDWLLVFDNAAEPSTLIPCLPQAGHGHVLITSRYRGFEQVASELKLDLLPEDDAVALLLGGTEAGAAERLEAAALAKDLGYLPLALAQAGAYVRSTGRRLGDYRALLATRRTDLLQRGAPKDAKLPVLLTWGPSLEAAAKECSAARPLLELLAFFAADPLPRTVLVAAPDALPEPLRDPLALDDAVTALGRFSLVTAAQGMLTVHRLVQAVTRDGLEMATATARAEAAVRLVNAALPWPSWEHTNWPAIGMLLPHAMATAEAAERLGADLETAANVLNAIALYHWSRAVWVEAEPLYQRAIAIGEKVLGPEHPDLAAWLNNLAELYRATGRYAEAEPLYQRAIAIDEKALGPEHPDLATDLNNLANLYRATGRYAEAEPLFQRALAISEKVLGPEHPDLAARLNNLAELYRATGRYAEAEPLLQRAIAIGEKTLGPEHPELADRLSNLAVLYRETGRYAEAEPLLQRALAIDEKALGPERTPASPPTSTTSPASTRPPAATPRPSRSMRAPSPSARRPSAPSTPTSPPTSTISPASTRTPAATPRPSRSLRAPLPSPRRPSAPSTPPSPSGSTTSPASTRTPAATPRPSRSMSAPSRLSRRACHRTIHTRRCSAETMPSSSTGSGAARRRPHCAPRLRPPARRRARTSLADQSNRGRPQPSLD